MHNEPTVQSELAKSKCIELTSDETKVNEWLSDPEIEKELVVGFSFIWDKDEFDGEVPITNNRISVFQVALREKCLIFQVNEDNKIPEKLEALIADTNTIKAMCGFNATYLRKLRELGLTLCHYMDLGDMERKYNKEAPKKDLTNLAEECFQKPFGDSQVDTTWSGDLTEDQKAWAASLSLVCIHVYYANQARVQRMVRRLALACDEDNCTRYFSSDKSLEHHKQIAHGHPAPHDPNAHPCPRCVKHFRSSTALVQHLEVSHPEYQLKRPDTQDGLTHTFFCGECDSGFQNKEQLLEHQEQTQHQSEKYVCEVCAKTFNHRSALDMHYDVTHGSSSGEPVHSCGVCNRFFSTLDALYQHQQCVGHSLSEVCNVCAASFGSQNDLQKHYTDTGHNNYYLCGSCPKKFADKDALSKHEHSTSHHGGGKASEMPPFTARRAALRRNNNTLNINNNVIHKPNNNSNLNANLNNNNNTLDASRRKRNTKDLPNGTVDTISRDRKPNNTTTRGNPSSNNTNNSRPKQWESSGRPTGLPGTSGFPGIMLPITTTAPPPTYTHPLMIPAGTAPSNYPMNYLSLAQFPQPQYPGMPPQQPPPHLFYVNEGQPHPFQQFAPHPMQGYYFPQDPNQAHVFPQQFGFPTTPIYYPKPSASPPVANFNNNTNNTKSENSNRASNDTPQNTTTSSNSSGGSTGAPSPRTLRSTPSTSTAFKPPHSATGSSPPPSTTGSDGKRDDKKANNNNNNNNATNVDGGWPLRPQPGYPSPNGGTPRTPQSKGTSPPQHFAQHQNTFVSLSNTQAPPPVPAVPQVPQWHQIPPPPHPASYTTTPNAYMNPSPVPTTPQTHLTRRQSHNTPPTYLTKSPSREDLFNSSQPMVIPFNGIQHTKPEHNIIPTGYISQPMEQPSPFPFRSIYHPSSTPPSPFPHPTPPTPPPHPSVHPPSIPPSPHPPSPHLSHVMAHNLYAPPSTMIASDHPPSPDLPQLTSPEHGMAAAANAAVASPYYNFHLWAGATEPYESPSPQPHPPNIHDIFSPSSFVLSYGPLSTPTRRTPPRGQIHHTPPSTPPQPAIRDLATPPSRVTLSTNGNISHNPYGN